VQHLLGHAKLAGTVRYLGIEHRGCAGVFRADLHQKDWRFMFVIGLKHRPSAALRQALSAQSGHGHKVSTHSHL
jgi:hypothetical protein